jgi:hypothetical protein
VHVYPVSSNFLAAIRQAHVAYTRLDIWFADALVASDVEFLDGQVTVNAGQGVRRQLDVTIADTAWWDTLAVIGTELRPYRGVRYPSGTVEAVPLGVFVVDQHSMNVAPGGGIGIRSAPDRWAYVQRARFETPQASTSGVLATAEAATLITAAVSTGVTDTTTSTATVGALVYERDREDIVNQLLTSAGAEAGHDWDGNLLVADAPLLGQMPAWTVDASASGVLLGGTRSRDRSRTYNVVVVTCTTLDGQTPPDPVVVEDDDDTSPTWVGGPMGRVPYFWASPVVLTEPQAQAAGSTILNRVKGANAQLDLEAAVNPALDRGDVIDVVTGDGAIERHLVASLTVPLTVGGTQSIATQSSRPDGDVPAGE